MAPSTADLVSKTPGGDRVRARVRISVRVRVRVTVILPCACGAAGMCTIG